MGKSAQIGFHVWLADAMEGKNAYVSIMFICYMLLCINAYAYMVYYLDTASTILLSAVVSGSVKVDVTKLQREVIAGLLMGDGHLRNPNKGKRPGGNYRLEFTFKESVLAFCKWIKFDLLGSVSTKTPPTPYPKDKPTQYWFATSNHSYFTQLYNVWYTKVNDTYLKVMPSLDYLNENFTAVSLAHLIMGDGYWENDSQTVFICTECFTLDEVSLLIKFFKDRFNLNCTLKKRGNGYRIRFSSAGNNLDKLRALVINHTHPSMLYKLGF